MGLSKKIMAGLAAAATLLAGLAVGATAVNAVEGDSTVAADDNLSKITLTASNADQFKTDENTIRTFKYAKLADYNFDSNSKPYLTTTSGVDQDVIRGALKSANLNPDDKLDPFTWLGSQDAKTIEGSNWRAFVESDALKNLTTYGVTPDVSADGKTLTFDFAGKNPGDRGLYLILDQSGDYAVGVSDGCTVTYHQMKAILIGTPLKDGEKELSSGSLTIADSVWGDIAPTDPVNVKSSKDEVCKPHPGFTKVDDNGNGLQGAVFSVYTAKQGATDDDFKNGVLANPIDLSKFDAYNQFGNPKTNTLTSDQDGKVDFGTLSAGTYYVYESTMPTVTDNSGKQYLTAYRAILKVTVTEGTQGNPGTFEIKDLNDNKLLTGDATNGYKYKNITSIIHLPLTGAAGTALFAVVAVLLAGGAGVTFVRSRAVKRDLR